MHIKLCVQLRKDSDVKNGWGHESLKRAFLLTTS